MLLGDQYKRTGTHTHTHIWNHLLDKQATYHTITSAPTYPNYTLYIHFHNIHPHVKTDMSASTHTDIHMREYKSIYYRAFIQKYRFLNPL